MIAGRLSTWRRTLCRRRIIIADIAETAGGIHVDWRDIGAIAANVWRITICLVRIGLLLLVGLTAHGYELASAI